MLADLAIIPIGHGAHTSDTPARVLKIIKDSGLSYQLTPTSTCIEGPWEQVLAVVKQCHDFARGDAPHVVTFLRIEDDQEQRGLLAGNVASVEARAGARFEKSPDADAHSEAAYRALLAATAAG